MKKEAKNAFKIGFVCIFTYLVSYYLRNVLSVLTPRLLDTGLFNKELVAAMSSTYMLVYAIGQLVNGTIGDTVKPKYMGLIGLILAGLGIGLVPFLPGYARVISFGVMGFGLSMLRGPFVKVISENTEAKYAQLCCVFLSFVAFIGPLLSSIAALFKNWQIVFVISGAASIFMGVFSFCMLTIFENNGLVKSINTQKGIRENFNPLTVLKLNKFVQYMVIGMVAEAAGTSIAFWIPTYVTQHLGFTPEASAGIYSAMSIIKAACPFLSLIFFRLFKKKDILLVRVCFLIGIVFYLLMCFTSNVWINILMLLIAQISSSIASSVLWSIYIPSLAKHGKVSSANGFMDFSGYFGASAANMVFAAVMSKFDWTGMMIAWVVLIGIGAVATIPNSKKTIEV